MCKINALYIPLILFCTIILYDAILESIVIAILCKIFYNCFMSKLDSITRVKKSKLKYIQVYPMYMYIMFI